MSSIEFVTSKVNEMSASLTTWNRIVIFFIAGTAIVASLYFVASYIAHKKAMQLHKFKDELIHLKDNDQALQITKVKTDSEEHIARVKADAEKQIALLNAETTKAKSEIAKAHAEVAKAREKAEAEQLERARLEAEFAPRNIEQRQSAKELEPFQGTSVIIEGVAEAEPWRFAMQISALLSNAKWHVLPEKTRFLDATMFFDGVAVETNVGPRPPEDRSLGAADALVEVLTKDKIQAHWMPSRDELPLNTVLVRVGFKPVEYFHRNRKDSEQGNISYEK
jgi:hypothetical protein